MNAIGQTLLNNVLRVTGDHKFGTHNAIAGLFLMPAAFYLGANWGPVGIAYGWVIAYPLLVTPLYRRVFHRLSITGVTYLGWLRPAIIAKSRNDPTEITVDLSPSELF